MPRMKLGGEWSWNKALDDICAVVDMHFEKYTDIVPVLVLVLVFTRIHVTL